MTPDPTFDQVFASLPGDGWLSRDEAELLWRVLPWSEGPILEVGCYRGRSTVLLASSGRPVYAVDPFQGFSTEDPSGDDIRRAFISNVLGRGISLTTTRESFSTNLTNGPIKGYVELFPSRVEDWHPRPVGMAYLDGDHTFEGTVNQINRAFECDPFVIAVHDVNDSGGGLEVKRACLSMLGPWRERVERLAVWRIRR